MAASRDGVYVVLVNWNGWRDTIECLESLFRSRYYPSFRVVVCDNASTDGSVDKIRRWANGELAVERGWGHPLASLVLPPVSKPIPHVVLSRAEAEVAADDVDARPLLTLVEVGANLGFAGGCNVGLRYALGQSSCGYVWLLNNDTVVDPEALGAVVRRLEARPDAGQCGSRILSYDEPSVVQARGGERYNRWLARSTPLGAGRPANDRLDVERVERKMSYVAGAALCVTRRFVETVGLLDESYFLYGEELDWLARARGRFALAYADESIVYHKEGGTIGSSRDGASRSALGDYFMVRSRLRFTWKHARLAFPTVVLGVLVAGINRIRRRQLDRAFAILRILFSRDTYSPAGRGRPPESLPEPHAARKG
jgi:GT2 family glycosyltransferase